MMLATARVRSEEHTSELQSQFHLVCRLLPEKKKHPEQLVAVGDATNVNSNGRGTPHTELLSAPLYRAVRENNHVFRGVLATGAARRLDARIDASSGELEHPRGRFVSGNYFDVLGVHAIAG